MSTTTTDKPKTTRSSTRKPLPDTSVSAGAMSAVEALAAADVHGEPSERILRLAPGDLRVGPNVRKAVTIDAAFRDSISELGIIIPITAYESPEGYVVVDGQRRTLAAVDLGLASVPVFVVAPPADADRLVTQIAVNERRADLTNTDAAAGVLELALFGMTVPAIAKRTGLSADLVANSAKVAGSTKALEVARDHPELNIAYIAELADFDDDPAAQKQLVELIEKNHTYNITHTAQRLRDARARAAVEAQIKAMPGVKLIPEPDPSSSLVWMRLRDLYKSKDRVQENQLEQLPHEEIVALAGADLGAYAGTNYGPGARWVIRYAITEWKAKGLFTESYYAQNKSATQTAADVERVKAEKRLARENGKIWQSATAVRIEWLKTLLARAKAPDGWDAFAAHKLAQNDTLSTSGTSLAAVLLGLAANDGPMGALRKHLATNPARAWRIALAIAIADVEGRREYEKKGWDPQLYVPGHGRSTVDYLKVLVGWGYEPGELEQKAIAGTAAKLPKSTTPAPKAARSSKPAAGISLVGGAA